MSQNLPTLPTHLQKMKFEMELRGLSPDTQKHYLSHLRLLEKHLAMPVPQVPPDELKQYLHCRIKAGISYSNINISCSSFKFFFNNVLKYSWSDDVIIRPKIPKKLPEVLSKDEILAIADQVSNLIDDLYCKNWVVFCKKPFKTPAHVVRYLGRYTHTRPNTGKNTSPLFFP